MSEATPIFFGEARHLFGWYHPACEQVARGYGIVLVPPIGHEYVCSYRAYRHLAERLAATGFAVLRFDYFGTGNSAGGDEDDGLVQAWFASIALAMDELRAHSGEQRTLLVGLRTGATLAAVTAAERGDVDALVLWTPCVTGKEYVRQIMMLGMMAEPHQPPVPHQDGIEAAGFFLSTATAQALSAVNLLHCQHSPAPHILLLERDDLPHLSPHDELAAHLRHCGADVDTEHFDGYPSFMTAPIESTLPHVALERIVQWLDGHYPPCPPTELRHTGHQTTSTRATLAEAPIAEEAVRFGEGLFGILTEPAAATVGETAVILLSAGGDHHIGPHRLYVPLARQWGTLGFSVLRFDLSGLGDSRARRPGNAEHLVYLPGAVEDVRAAVEYLRHSRGFERIVVIGICSGAYYAIHAAHQNVPITGIIAVNPPLYWKQGNVLELDPYWEAIEARRLGRALLSWTKWKRLLTDGDGISHILRLLAQHWGVVSHGTLTSLRRVAHRDVSHIQHDDIFSLFPSHVRTHLIFSPQDPGFIYLERRAGSELHTLRARDNVSLDVIDGADHTFMPRHWQRRLSELLTVQLLQWSSRIPGSRLESPSLPG